MIDMDCVAKAIECCLKYPYYTATVVLCDWLDYYSIYKELSRSVDGFYCQSFWHCREFYFENGSVLVLVLDHDSFKGKRTNCLIYDDAVDEQTRQQIFEPMIVSYTL